ncbi:AsmA family protein [Pseudoroseomonas globiformis]|uniref:AsmA family protein n=1 Tax=Teichococcus globiformis TaxID=2307229 RepID=A0ABV7G4G2_9PROT
MALLVPALLLAALWFGPRLTDWNEYRDRLAILAAGRLGQPVTLAGPVRLALLPQPMLEAGGVTIGGPDAEISVQAQALRLRLDWSALLQGRLEPREVAVVGAEIRLPWPPAPGRTFRPPPWLTGLEGRIQESRVVLGAVVLERVEAMLAASGPADALRIQGRFRWRGTDSDFETTVGRPGWDGIAPLALTLSAARASISASGVLLPEGGFEGSVQGGGSDLAALLPAPTGAFRLRGRLSVDAELLTADELSLDIAGTPARGAATLRVEPVPRLDLALSAGRLELDPWIAALRSAGRLPLPFGLDLSAEAAGFRGNTLRRLRGAVLLEGERLILTDFSAVLPGDTEVELSGSTSRSLPPAQPGGGARPPTSRNAQGETAQGRAGSSAAPAWSDARLEAALRFRGSNLRGTLLALGVPLQSVDPARLRDGEGRLRLTLEDGQLTLPEFAATLDGARISGAGTLRLGNRPALGLGLNLERLQLDGWLPPGMGWPEIQAHLAGIDANLRVSAAQARWHDLAVEGLSADLSLESGRLTARRLAGRSLGADLVLSGAAQLGETPRLSELAVEATAERGATLLAAVARRAGGSLALAPLFQEQGLAQERLALRLTGNGPPQALALQGNLELGDLRAEANGTLDLPSSRYTGALTLRHPGAPRLLTETAGLHAPPWLGEGSFSFAGNLTAEAGKRGAVSIGQFDMIAAGLHLGGQLNLMLDGARPRLSGRLRAETLPLPTPDTGSREPLSLSGLVAADAELALHLRRIDWSTGSYLEDLTTTLRLEAGRLRLDDLRARLGGGTLEGTLGLDAAASPPVLDVQGRLSGASLTTPWAMPPLELRTGQLEAEAKLRATGHSPAALLATSTGEGRLALREGVLGGVDLRSAYLAAEAATMAAAEAGLRTALSGGATGFEALDARLQLDTGRLTLVDGRLAMAETPGAILRGEADLARGTADLMMMLKDGEAPEFGLRLTGPIRDARRVLELADWLSWRALH